jgi:hypothetical protein
LDLTILEDDSQHEPIAQAQHQSQSVVFDLPDTDGSHSPTRPMNSSSSSDSTGQPRPVIPTVSLGLDAQVLNNNLITRNHVARLK